MTHETPDDIDHEMGARPDKVGLPLVSVVIVNYNYGRFLDEAVGSVFAQTYPHVECIVVDNASTDRSPAVLERLMHEHPSLRVVRRERNDGQTPASLDGLAASSGAYVIFVDADDMLLPTCVEAHVFAHLSLRVHVGFTSGDMLQVDNGQVVVATGEDFNRYIRGGRGLKPELIRPYRPHTREMDWPRAETSARLEGKIHVVPPFNTRWIWSPTSGSCYRRDALLLFADHPGLASLRTGTDMYFGHAIGALCGSALIDEPVFAYRIHGGNIYTHRAQLDRTLCFRPGSSGDSNATARLMIVDHLVTEADRFAPNIWLKLNLVWLLLRLDVPDHDPSRPGRQRRSHLARALAENGDAVRPALGPVLTSILKFCAWLPYPRL